VITIHVQKDKRGLWEIRANDVSTDKTIAKAGGDSPRDAARWLVHKLNRVLSDVEILLVEMELITDAEIDAISDAVTEQLITKDSDQ